MSDIAILIPTYKPKDYIYECLQSIDNQDFHKQDYKVYIALNGSTYEEYQKLLNILKKFTFNYEVFYIKQAGVSLARNYLLNRVQEEYIVFLDDDDVVSSNYLSELFKVTTSKRMGITNTFNFVKSISEKKSNYIGESFKKLRVIENSKIKSRKYFSSPWAKMLHQNMIKNVRFDEKLKIGEDSLFMAMISKNIEAVVKTDATACYYVRERVGSATRSRVDRLAEIKRIYYLLRQYTVLFFQKKYNKIFILTRILATVQHLQKIFIINSGNRK